MKLAVVIEGDQNSGKTSTIKHLVNSYGGKSLNQIRQGWQKIYLNSNFKNLKLIIYCIPSSPSESNNPLGNRFKSWLPDVILLAEQPNGKHYNNSMDFLQNNRFNILKFSISNINGSGVWERFDQSSMQPKLDIRADQIISEIRLFLNTNGVI